MVFFWWNFRQLSVTLIYWFAIGQNHKFSLVEFPHCNERRIYEGNMTKIIIKLFWLPSLLSQFNGIPNRNIFISKVNILTNYILVTWSYYYLWSTINIVLAKFEILERKIVICANSQQKFPKAKYLFGGKTFFYYYYWLYLYLLR